MAEPNAQVYMAALVPVAWSFEADRWGGDVPAGDGAVDGIPRARRAGCPPTALADAEERAALDRILAAHRAEPTHYGIEWYGEAGQDGARTACGIIASFDKAVVPKSGASCPACQEPCACAGGPRRCRRCL